MIFNSIEFALFLPIVFLLYWFVFNRNYKLQNIFVVVVSYIFYGWWDWRFLILIAFTSFCSWASGIAIERSRGNAKKFICGANIVVNLAILGIFKYYNFFVTEFTQLVFGGNTESWLINVILPVGISFYTFQALSYSIDVFRGNIKATRDCVQFFAFVSFFPQLVAGPIERATNLLPQFARERHFDYAQAVDGLRQMLWGLFKKMVIADNCAKAVDIVWAKLRKPSRQRARNRRNSFRVPNLRRFFWLFRHRNWLCKTFRHLAKKEFSLSVFFARHRRILAPLAHFAQHLVSRLSLHSARRLARGNAKNAAKHFHHFCRLRTLAWRKLDLHRLGTF